MCGCLPLTLLNGTDCNRRAVPLLLVLYFGPKLVSLAFPIRFEELNLPLQRLLWSSLYPQGHSTTKCALIKPQSSLKTKPLVIVPMVSTADLKDLVHWLGVNTEKGNLFQSGTM